MQSEFGYRLNLHALKGEQMLDKHVRGLLGLPPVKYGYTKSFEPLAY